MLKKPTTPDQINHHKSNNYNDPLNSRYNYGPIQKSINYGSKTYSQMKNKINYTKSNLKEKNEDNENINNFNKKHSNNETKNKIFYKPRKNFSVNFDEMGTIKEENNENEKEESYYLYDMS